ncbi:MAG: SDR family oxidoreductase [Parvularcula sp.]|jgi:nucleoside-diphosphate-sugar epimerase|nr:SDR family oxidoreductase [Parvularcula sp.]
MTGNVLFLGLGYSARPLAQRLVKEGWSVKGTTRDRTKAMRLAAEGIAPLVWSAPQPLPKAAAEEADVIVVSTGPSQGTCPSLSALPPDAFYGGTQVLYLSSSGVYGDKEGGWIDENEPCHPETERGKDRLSAEEQWVSWAKREGARLTLCRLAGIYGPGRSAIDSLRGDTPGARAGLTRRLDKPGQVFNRIHRDDIAAGHYALMGMGEPPEIVNFADDHPSPSADPITFAAELLGIEPPPLQSFKEVEEELSPMARSFYAENKRLRNDRLKALPGFSLRYPSYKEGLRAIYER